MVHTRAETAARRTGRRNVKMHSDIGVALMAGGLSAICTATTRRHLHPQARLSHEPRGLFVDDILKNREDWDFI